MEVRKTEWLVGACRVLEMNVEKILFETVAGHPSGHPQVNVREASQKFLDACNLNHFSKYTRLKDV